jgi:hypothetical protein
MEISFTVIFSILFMLIYKPFSIAVWFSTDDTLRFGFTIIFYMAAIVILILSRSLMNIIQDRLKITSLTYVWWLMAENLLISLLYTIITISLFPMEGVATPTIAIKALMCVTLILIIPNGIIFFYAAFRAKCEELEATQYQLQRLGEEYRLLESSKEHEIRAVVNSSNIVNNSKGPTMISLYDNNNILRLTINVDSLYYLESEDNYIKVHYKHNDKITSYMLRCRTRSVEKSLEGTCMVRCHRSYIVNINKIRFLEEERRLHYLALDDDSIRRIPVSKSYYNTLVAIISPKKQQTQVVTPETEA